jgi:hypothetical protein
MMVPLMRKATAMWLIQNTILTFQQIADFCGMHVLEIQGMADEEVDRGIIPIDPIVSGQLTREEIARCESDSSAKLLLSEEAMRLMQAQKSGKRGSKYVPVARRGDKPGAVAWLLKNYPLLADAQIVKLIGTTKATIEAVRSKTHWNQNIKPSDPVLLGLCSQSELEAVNTIAQRKAAALEVRHNELVTLELNDKLKA